MIKKNMQNKEFVKLSWKLLEYKVMYYLFPLHESNISDSEYDMLEKRYLFLCNKFKWQNTVQSMVGVDQSRPSVQLVIKKICRIPL